MRTLFEISIIGGLALAAHLAAWIGLSEAGDEAAGDQGDAVITLTAASAEIAQLVETWNRPVEAMQALPDAPVLPPTEAGPAAPFAAPEAPKPSQTPPRPVQATVPNAMPAIDRESFTHPAAAAAPSKSMRPKTRPAREKTVPKKKTAKKQTAQKSATNTASAGSAAQKAAGAKKGTNAGNQKAAQTATLSKSARNSLMAKWGTSIRSSIERRKRYPSGTTASGKTVLKITVSPMGRLLAVRIRSSSGDAQLDRAAVTAAKKARYPAAPKGLTAKSYDFNLPLNFRRK